MIPNEIKHQVLQELNEKDSRVLLDLDKCTELYNSLLQDKSAIEAELNPLNPKGFIGATLNEAKSIVDQSELTIKNSLEVHNSLNNELNELEVVRSDLKSKFEKLYAYQTTLQYYRVIQQVDYLCIELQREVSKKDDEKCVTLFANLTEILRILADCPVNNLNNHLKENILHWHTILRQKLSKDFELILKQMKWPFLSANFNLVTPIEANVHRLQIVAEYLVQIEIPPEVNVTFEIPSGVLSDFSPPCLPIQLLIEPLKKRFMYHFYGNRKTNRPDKPEWYFTQILTWVRDHQDYVGTWIQPVIDKFGLHHLDAKSDFIRSLVLLAAEKLNLELPELQYDDYLFSHSIDEALGFDKELRDVYNYPSNQPSIVAVLTQAPVLVKWLLMEKKYATEKMDAMLSPNCSEAFDLLTSDVENLKITTCADAFITLLQTITERYECLPQPGHRLQFLELQLELLDDFRVRLLQIINAEEGDYMDSKVPMIANTLYYIENVLVDWGSMLHYLNLFYYKSQIDEAQQPTTPVSPFLNDFDDNTISDLESDSLFIETLSLYRHFRRDLLCGLAEAVILEVKKRSYDYRRERWSHMKVAKEFRSLSLTPSACPIFEVLAKRLHQLQKKLHSKLFTIVWRNIATQLDTYLFEDLVMDNRFNDGGALQLKFDITRNLLPLFSQYTDTPATYFTQLLESCTLLNLLKGSALLLRETILALEGATGVEDTRGKYLKEIGVTNFGPKMAVKILNQRTDITVNRHAVD
ncbi:RAD50-interacting protein 1 [Anthonomus grandis grandis]|uniref:RAD50-interacting protein 1 n=1 Tax=Anthonomus grandis grandis TaxID=2921223 RepID=UPI00216505C1|nr:RAD50-interacting protein 1 [Anthonomus grandis grandis]